MKEDDKLEELIYEVSRYRWNLMAFNEVLKLGSHEILTIKGHKLLYTGKDNKHINGVGFLIHYDLTRMIMCLEPINHRIAMIRLQVTPFNISIIQVYALIAEYSDE